MGALEIGTSILVSILVGTILVMIRSIVQSKKDMEIRLRGAVTDEYVRRLIDDKVAPVREDIREIKADYKEIRGTLARIEKFELEFRTLLVTALKKNE